jgi:hypothetical protein
MLCMPPSWDVVYIDGVGFMATQAQQHSHIAGVALAGGAQGAMQPAAHSDGLCQQFRMLKTRDKLSRRSHRPDGV